VNTSEPIGDIPTPSALELDEHFNEVVGKFQKGEVVIFLGADVNWCDRPTEDFTWKPEESFHPSRKELACYLAEKAEVRLHGQKASCHNMRDQICSRMAIQHISEHIDIGSGLGRASEELHNFYSKYSGHHQPNRLHFFLSKLPKLLRDKDYAPPYPLIITANYDSILELALKSTSPPTPFDLVYHKMTDRMTGKFYHRTYEGETYQIEKPNEYDRISFDNRPVILKLYGAIGLDADEGVSDKKYFVVTEDDYINFLADRTVSEIMPVGLLLKLWHSHILFLGYRVRDWHQRVVIHRIWHKNTSYNSWAVHKNPTRIDRHLWERNTTNLRVNVIKLPIEDYADRLEKSIQNCPPAKPTGEGLIRPTPPTGAVVRHKLFISYSHKDKKWLDRFRKMLSPLEQKKTMSIWADNEIEPGNEWKREIEKALSSAKVALLLVSQDFLDSRFIMEQELPFFLKAAKDKGLVLYWVLLDHCLVEETEITDYQAAHDIKKPLSDHKYKTKIVATICRKISEAMST
jgi:hypothetical protein